MALKLLLASLVGVLIFVGCGPVPTETQAPPDIAVEIEDGPVMQLVDFQQFPLEYQSATTPIYLAEKISVGEASIVALPSTQEQPSLAQEVFQMQLDSAKFDLSNFSVEHTVTFSTAEYSYVAVPIAFEPVYDFSAGVMAGLLEDIGGGYTGTTGSYEVWFFEEGVGLHDSNGTQVYFASAGEQGTDFFWEPQVTYVAEPLAYFVENGCWLCWSLDGRCGCLICK